MIVMTTNLRSARSGFTLIEVLIVIAIIAILVGLTTAGVMYFGRSGPDMVVKAEIRQFDSGLKAAMQELNGVTYVPSYLALREDNEYVLSNPAEAATVSFLQKAFGKRINLTPVSLGGSGIDWNGNGGIDSSAGGPYVLQGHHCLVFWLGGIPAPVSATNPTLGFLGFSTDPTNPAAPGGSRKGPWFQFKTARLVMDANTFLYYTDGYTGKGPITAMPYAFFSGGSSGNAYQLGVNSYQTVAGDCPTLGVLPYFQGSGTQIRFENKGSFQVISAGRDGLFGPGGQWNPTVDKSPSTVAVPNPGYDDLSNFGRLELGKAQ